MWNFYSLSLGKPLLPEWIFLDLCLGPRRIRESERMRIGSWYKQMLPLNFPIPKWSLAENCVSCHIPITAVEQNEKSTSPGLSDPIACSSATVTRCALGWQEIGLGCQISLINRPNIFDYINDILYIPGNLYTGDNPIIPS